MKKVDEQCVYQALNELGFDKYVSQLKEEMRNYSEKEDAVKKNLIKKRKQEQN